MNRSVSLCRFWYTPHHEAYSIIILDMFHMLSLSFTAWLHHTEVRVTARELLWRCMLPFRFENLHFPTYNHKSKQTILTYVRVSRDVSIETPAWLDELCGSWLDKCSHFCVLIEMMTMDALSREIKLIGWKFWPLNITSVCQSDTFPAFVPIKFHQQ